MNWRETTMHMKKKLALTLGLLLSLGAHAETYRWDNVAMGGAGFVTGVVPSKLERGVVYARTDVGGPTAGMPRTAAGSR
jgi:hypothetical protein